MISSPCRNCRKRSLSKEQCVRNCELLQKLQTIQLAMEDRAFQTAIDHAEESRYHLYSFTPQLPG